MGLVSEEQKLDRCDCGECVPKISVVPSVIHTELTSSEVKSGENDGKVISE